MMNDLFKPEVFSIERLFKYQYNIPVYQRPYSWEQEQITGLYNDIKLEYEENDGKSEGLYVGNIILYNTTLGSCDIIDGQQRVVTFTLLLLAIYARYSELSDNFPDSYAQTLQRALWESGNTRNPIKDKRRVTLGSVDKEILIRIFDSAYSDIKKLHAYVSDYKTHNKAEENIKNNFIEFYNCLFNDYKDIDSLWGFANFILEKTSVIAIITGGSEKKAFKIFESVNSKGKKLEDIDLIKTHIFSTFEENDYQPYLTKWGDLIVNTDDDLYGYLKTYLLAYIKYQKANIHYKGFNALGDDLCKFYNVNKISEAYKAMIDDMTGKIEFYKALFDVDKAYTIIRDHQLRFYFLIYTRLKYEFPRPLFFRVFIEYKKGNLSESDAVAIIKETIKTMISCVTIANKENKEIPEVFEKILVDIFSKDKNKSANKIDKDFVLYALNEKIQKFGLTSSDIKNAFMRLDCYDKNKQLGAAVISVFDAKEDDGNIKISWDKAYAHLSAYGKAYQLDHIMNQNPERTDPNLKYYQINNNLKLKDGHDFPSELVSDNMPYADFMRIVLHTVGNLRLKGGDGNAARGNKSDENFCTYNAMKNRTQAIADFIMQNFLNIESGPKDYTTENVAPPSTLKGNYCINAAVSFTNAKFKSLTVFDKTYPLKNNRDLLINLILYLYDDNEFRPKIIKLAKEHWAPRGSVFLADNKEAIIRKSRPIADIDKYIFTVIENELYMYGTLSSKAIILYANKLTHKVGLPDDFVTVYI